MDGTTVKEIILQNGDRRRVFHKIGYAPSLVAASPQAHGNCGTWDELGNSVPVYMEEFCQCQRGSKTNHENQTSKKLNFKSIVKRLECDMDLGQFSEKLGRIARAKPPSKKSQ
jgi:hypothetical protein